MNGTPSERRANRSAPHARVQLISTPALAGITLLVIAVLVMIFPRDAADGAVSGTARAEAKR